MSEDCQSVIRKRMGDWLELSDRYGVVGLSMAGAPWTPPSLVALTVLCCLCP